jgi:hypothetical protein
MCVLVCMRVGVLVGLVSLFSSASSFCFNWPHKSVLVQRYGFVLVGLISPFLVRPSGFDFSWPLKYVLVWPHGFDFSWPLKYVLVRPPGFVFSWPHKSVLVGLVVLF